MHCVIDVAIEWSILAFCLLLNLPALRMGFVGDDSEIWRRTEDTKIALPKQLWRRLWWFYRGKAYALQTFEKTTPTSPNYPLEAHAVALLIHYAVCIIIAYLWGPLAAAFFSVHPATQEVSHWLSGKPYGMTALVVLVGWMFPLLWVPMALFLPWEFLYTPGFTASALFLWKPWPYCLVALTLLWLAFKHLWFIYDKSRNIKAVAFEGNPYSGRISPAKIIIFCKFLGYAFVNGFYCLASAYYHKYLDDYADSKQGIIKGTRLDAFFWVGAVIIYVLITNIIWGPHTLQLFALYWFFIFMMLWCNGLNFGQQYIANRYYYLPYVGVAIIAAQLAASPYTAWLFYILLGLHIREFIYNRRQYINAYWHIEWQVWNEPDHYYSWILMGVLNFNRGHFTRAIEDFNQALACRKDNFKALFNLSSCYLARGEFKEAQKFIKLAMAADIFGQEKYGEKIIKERLQFAIWMVKNYDKIRLREIIIRPQDIPTVM